MRLNMVRPMAMLLALAACTAIFSSHALAKELQPRRLISENATVYVEVGQPELLLDHVLDSTLQSLLGRSGKVQKYYQSKDFRQLKTAVTLIETRLGRKWQQLARELAGSVHFGYEVPSQTSLIILQPQRAETLTELHRALVDLIELDANSKGKESPIISAEYKGITTWSFGPQDHHAIAEGLLLQSNQLAGLQAAIDRTADQTLPSLADTEFFQEARTAAGERPVAWTATRLDELRKVPKLAMALEARSGNPGGALVAGGVLDVIRTAPWVVSALQVNEERVWRSRTELRLASEASATRGWYFAAPAENATSLLSLPGTLLSISAYRDVASMWQSRDELFDEEAAAKLAQADTNLGLYFAGQDFGTQILSEFGPHWQLAIARQQYQPDKPIPAVKLPALAFVMELKNPKRFGTTLLVSFQKAIGLINLVGGQQGQQQLLLSSEDYGGTSLSKATYLFDDRTDKQAAPIYYNASPACALSGNYFIIGTTTQIVRQTIDAIQQSKQSGERAANTEVHFSLVEIAAALADNRTLLVSQNVLKEGNTMEQAEDEVSLVLDLLRLAAHGSLKLDKRPQSLVLEATVGGAK